MRLVFFIILIFSITAVAQEEDPNFPPPENPVEIKAEKVVGKISIDGKLDEEERKEAMSARRAEFIKKYDKDGDGELNEEERKEAMKARRGGRPQGRRPEGGRPGGGRPEGGRPGGRRPGGEKPGDKKPDA